MNKVILAVTCIAFLTLPAAAKMLSIVCNGDDGSVVTYYIDLDGGTVRWFDAVPAGRWVTLSARVTEQTIGWRGEASLSSNNWSLDRYSGILTNVGRDGSTYIGTKTATCKTTAKRAIE